MGDNHSILVLIQRDHARSVEVFTLALISIHQELALSYSAGLFAS